MIDWICRQCGSKWPDDSNEDDDAPDCANCWWCDVHRTDRRTCACPFEPTGNAS